MSSFCCCCCCFFCYCAWIVCALCCTAVQFLGFFWGGRGLAVSCFEYKHLHGFCLHVCVSWAEHNNPITYTCILWEEMAHCFLLYLTNHHPFHTSCQSGLLAPPSGLLIDRAPPPFARRSPVKGTLDMPGAVASGYDQDYYYTQC